LTACPGELFFRQFCGVIKVNIMLNGKKEDILNPISIKDFIKAKGWEPDRIVVEINLEILSKDAWSEVILKENDHVEILAFVGGGKNI